MDGNASIYFDAAEHSHIDESSPWASGVVSPTGHSSSVLPAAAHGYLSIGTPSIPLSETETRDDESLAGSTMEGSYAGHLRAQSSLPKKWLADVDIEPYLRIPGGKGLRGKGVFAGRGMMREPLLEELLPTSRKETLFPAIHGPVEQRDRIVALIYWGMLAFMLLMGAGLCLIYPSELRERVIRSNSMFRAIVDSVWILATAIAVGSTISVLWAVLLRFFTGEIVHLMIYFAPVMSGLAGLWAAVEFLHADIGSGIWLLLAAVAGLATSALFTMFVLANRRNIRNTIEIVRMAAEVLTANPGIYMVSFLLLVAYVLFVGVWLIFYAHALMLGHVESRTWQLSTLSYYVQAYLVFMLVWTSIIFSSVQKCVIGGVVGRWYFFRTDPDEVLNSTGSAWTTLHASLTTFFGQICTAASVLSLVRLTRGLIQASRWVASKLESTIFNSAVKSLGLFFGFVERLFEHITDLSIYYVALTGESFWSSGRTVFKVFRRNMLLGFTTDTLSNLIFMISTTAVAAITGLSSYIFIAHVLHSPYGFSGAVLFALLTWYVLRFFTSIFSDTMDAAFVCFAIDLDTEKLHSPAVHQAFFHRVVPEGNV